MFTFSTVDLEAALMRCNNVLTTYTDPATKKWDTRMSNLTMKWDSSRKCLLEAVLSCEGLPSPNICLHCCEGKVPGGYSHTLPIRVCAAQRGRDFEAPDLERGIHFRGVF